MFHLKIGVLKKTPTTTGHQFQNFLLGEKFHFLSITSDKLSSDRRSCSIQRRRGEAVQAGFPYREHSLMPPIPLCRERKRENTLLARQPHLIPPARHAYPSRLCMQLAEKDVKKNRRARGSQASHSSHAQGQAQSSWVSSFTTTCK